MKWRDWIIYRAFREDLDRTAGSFLALGWLCMSSLPADVQQDTWSRVAACCFAAAVVPLLGTFAVARNPELARRGMLLGLLPTIGIISTIVGVGCWLVHISPYAALIFLVSAVGSCIVLVWQGRRKSSAELPEQVSTRELNRV